MSQRCPTHDKLFRAVVVMGAAIGAAACVEHGKTPPPSDARVADASTVRDGGLVDTPVDVIAIL